MQPNRGNRCSLSASIAAALMLSYWSQPAAAWDFSWEDFQPSSGLEKGKWSGPNGSKFSWQVENGQLQFQVDLPAQGVFGVRHGDTPENYQQGGTWSVPGDNGQVTFGTNREMRVEVPVGPFAGIKSEGTMNANWEYQPKTAEFQIGIDRALFTSYKEDKTGVFDANGRLKAAAKLKLVIDGIDSGHPSWGYGAQLSIAGIELINDSYVGYGLRDFLGNGLLGRVADLMRFRQDSLLDLSQGRAPNLSDVDAELPDMAAFLAYINIGGDPLAIDLDGDGIETLGAQGQNAVHFDHDGDGVATATGWLAPDDGWIVRDRNGDGQITTGNELFGVDTIMSDGSHAVDGLSALADLDSERDGVLDVADSAYSTLQVWQDINGNGQSEAFELQTLEQAGIASIGLSATGNIAGSNGNTFAGIATYTRTDGSTGIVANLVPAENDFDAKFTVPVEISAEAAALPYMGGSGFARPLREAMSLDNELLYRVAAFAADSTRDGQRAKVDEILARWAQEAPQGSLYHHAVATNTPLWVRFERRQKKQPDANGIGGISYSPSGTQGTQGVYASVPDYGVPAVPGWTEDQSRQALYDLFHAEAARLGVVGHTKWLKEVLEISDNAEVIQYKKLLAKLTAVEVFSGVESRIWDDIASDQYGKRVTFTQTNTRGFDAAYRLLSERVYGALAVQTRFQSYLDLVPEPQGRGSLDFSALNARWNSELAAEHTMVASTRALPDLIDFVRHAGPMLMRFGWNPRPLLDIALSDTLLATLEHAQANSGDAGCFWQLQMTEDNQAHISESYLGNLQTRHGVFQHWSNPSPYVRPDSFLVTISPPDPCGQFRWFNYIWTGPILNPTNTTPLLYEHHRNNHDILWNVYEASSGVGDDLLFISPQGGKRFDGGAGDDTYVVGANYGALEIGGAHLATDTIQFIDGVRPEDVNVLRSGSNLTLEVVSAPAETRTRILVPGFFYRDGESGSAIGVVSFTDGTFWADRDVFIKALDNGDEGGVVVGYDTQDFIDAQDGDDLVLGRKGHDFLLGGRGNDTLKGEQGRDYLYGGFGNDVLDGGTEDDVLDDDAGDDRFWGGGGDDLYLVGGLEAGNDHVTDTGGANDRLVLATDVEVSMVQVRHLNRDMLLTVSGNGHTRSITVHEQFGDAATGRLETVAIGHPALVSWDDAEMRRRALLGTEDGNTIQGFASDDTIAALGGDDHVFAGDGDDVVDGGAGNDLIEGGVGSDTVRGGEGDDSVLGNDGDDVLDGGAGDDLLVGGNGNDTFIFGLGHDEVQSGNNSPEDLDRVVFDADIVPANVTVTRQGMLDLKISARGGADILLVPGFFSGFTPAPRSIDEFQFGDGAVLGAVELAELALYGDGSAIKGDANNNLLLGLLGADLMLGHDGDDTLNAGSGDDTLYGGRGNDSLSGEDGNDWLHGGIGRDTLRGGVGSDKYIIGPSDGIDTILTSANGSVLADVEVLQFMAGVNPDQVRVSRADLSSRGLRLELPGVGNQVTVAQHFAAFGAEPVDSVGQIDEVRFANGTVWTKPDLRQRVLQGHESSQQIFAFDTNDVIDGLGGSDLIYGYGGSDVLHGGAGDDSILGGDGNDQLFGDVGDDRLSGEKGDDVLDGGAGNDILSGHQGNDRYIFGLGYGTDVIQNSSGLAGEIDVLELASNVTPAQVALQKQGYFDVKVVLSDASTITISQYLSSNTTTESALDEIRFADGTVCTPAEVATALANSTSVSAETACGDAQASADLMSKGWDFLKDIYDAATPGDRGEDN